MVSVRWNPLATGKTGGRQKAAKIVGRGDPRLCRRQLAIRLKCKAAVHPPRPLPQKNQFLRASAFAMWLAGGGIKRGLAYGATDDIGYYITEKPVGIRDLQATILRLLGFDPYRFSYRFQGSTTG